jgi:hypothetical protein
MSKRSVTFFSLWVLLSGSLIFQGHGSPTLDQLVQKKFLAELHSSEYTRSGFSFETYYAEQFSNLGIKLHPGSDFTKEDQPTPRSLNHCKSLVYRTLKSLPAEHVAELKNLTLYFSNEGRRGLGGGSTIILRCQNVTDSELIGVLVHEMGHIVDTGLYQGSVRAGKSEFNDGGTPVYRDDPSLAFYRLGFENEKSLKSDASALDFISGYSASDPFEDFAESYNYYVLHGNEFRLLARTNKILQKKYSFLKNRIFQGKEFINGNVRGIKVAERSYDATIMPYDPQKFLVL